MKKNEYSKRRFGFIAQNIKEYFPELVTERTDSQDSYMMMNYSGMIPITVKAIQEQQELILVQQKTLDSQQEKIELLLKRIESLESH